MTKNLQNDQNCTRNDQTRNQKIKILEKTTNVFDNFGQYITVFKLVTNIQNL